MKSGKVAELEIFCPCLGLGRIPAEKNRMREEAAMVLSILRFHRFIVVRHQGPEVRLGVARDNVQRWARPGQRKCVRKH